MVLMKLAIVIDDENLRGQALSKPKHILGLNIHLVSPYPHNGCQSHWAHSIIGADFTAKFTDLGCGPVIFKVAPIDR